MPSDAPGFFAPIVNGAKQTPPLRYNVFGVTAGGPIRRNRTFFSGTEGTRRHTGSVTTLTVPSDLQRAGDFSSTLNAQGTVIPVYDPAGSPRQPFPGNVVPKDRLDSVGLRVVNYFPRATRAPDNLAGANNFRSNSVTAVNSDFLLAKLDHGFNERNKLTVRYIGFHQTTDPSSVYPDAGADPAIHSRAVGTPTPIGHGLPLRPGRRPPLSFM